MLENKSEIIFYQSEDGKNNIEIRLEKETVWLTQEQLAKIFEKERSVITKHIKNIFESGELEEKSNVQKMHIPNSDKPVKFFNLDVAISVGYRVNSKRGTQFRIWASQVLKDHLINGYSINEKKLKEESQKLVELQKTVALLEKTVQNQVIAFDETKELIKIVADYAYALAILDQYDHQSLKTGELSKKHSVGLEYDECMRLIKSMKSDFGTTLFGREKDESFRGVIGTIYQTFGGVELYPSIEEKAAHLLYFIVKDHSFSDGNKRIAAAVFIYFLAKNKVLYNADGSKRIADNALVALTLMIAESRPEEKDIIVKVVVNLINGKNK